MTFFYVYILESVMGENFYVGFTEDLQLPPGKLWKNSLIDIAWLIYPGTSANQGTLPATGAVNTAR